MLHRRQDLSTFLVHFTREGNGRSAFQNLVRILSDSSLMAGVRMGKAKDRNDVGDQEVVCFTETPLEQSWTMVQQIEGRQVPLEPYGVVFTKIWARKQGVNPVWYIDATPEPGHHWLVNYIDTMMEGATDGDEIFRLTPFFEVMGTWTRFSRHEFWWEREWRKVGDLNFTWPNLVTVLAPAREHNDLRRQLLNQFHEADVRGLTFLDPNWGLERMIGSLAGIANDILGPLPPPPPGR